MTYRGRFAPSPTGHLHFGSLVAATGSYLQAKVAHGKWLIRIEDLDTPRVVPGSTDSILRSLEWLGFEWEQPVVFQSARIDAYQQAFNTLRSLDLIYPCSCSRSELQASTPSNNDGDELRYPGFCRLQPRRVQQEYAWRFKVPDQAIEYHDALHGALSNNLQDSIGDFVIKRRDGLFAYQLAVVVDDAAQGITEVVRGADLLSNTPRQIALQHVLNLDQPNYVHLPVVLDAQGNKLSKSQHAPHLLQQNPSQLLWQALDFLQQSPPKELQYAAITDGWQWAIQNWQLNSLILS